MPLKGQSVISSERAVPALPHFSCACPGAPHCTAYLCRVDLHVERQACSGLILGSLSCARLIWGYCAVLGAFDNAADCFVPTSSPVGCVCCTHLHALRSTRRLSTLADSCCKSRDGAAGALVHGLTSGACRVVQSVPTAWLEFLAAETDHMELGTSPRSIERSIRLCPRPCVRLLPQTAQLGQPSPAPSFTRRSAGPRRRKSVQRSVAAAMSALAAPSVHALTRACGLAGCPRLGTGRRLQHGPAPECPGALNIAICRATDTSGQRHNTLQQQRRGTKSFISQHPLSRNRRVQVPCNPGRFYPIKTAVKREAQ